MTRVLADVPAGRVITHRMIAAALDTTAPHVMQLVAALAARGDALPWWRIVADGGAIGRLAHREAQIAKLGAEGVLVSPAGIVQGLAKHLPGAKAASAADATPSAAPARSRGMKGKPTSTVGR